MLGEAAQRVSQAVCFFLLAAVLSPHAFGLAAVAFLAVQIANSVTYAGLGQAVQTLGVNRSRDRTAMVLAWMGGGAGALLLAVAAPLICSLLRAPHATNLVRLVALALPLGQFAEVKTALMERRAAFAKTSAAQISASVLSAAVGVTLALIGAGPAALVAQAVAQQAIRAAVLVTLDTDGLGVGFNLDHARQLWGIGRHLLGSGILVTAYGNADNATVSAMDGAAALGGYGFVYNLANLPYYLVGLASNRVMLPTYAQRLRANQPLREHFQGAILAVGVVGALPLGYLLLVGPQALRVIFGGKWDYVGLTLQFLAAFAWLRTVIAQATPVLVATGHARRQKQSQAVLLALLAVLVVPFTRLWGTVGTAIAVTVPQLLVGAWLLRLSTRLSGASAAGVAGMLARAAAVGVLTGVCGHLVLERAHGIAALALSIVASIAVWGAAAGWLYITTTHRPGWKSGRPGATAVARAEQ